MPDARMADKVCIVTGAGNSIGAATAELLAEHGAQVICADVDGPAAKRTAERIEAADGNASSFELDISDPAAARALVEHTVAVHGRVDVLHNNAGIGVLGAAHEASDADWRRCLDVNLNGTLYVTRAALEPMLAQRRGAIVNTCSTFAVVAAPRMAAYAASKGAIRALTRQMARDYSPDIRVNSVSPGFTDTNMTRFAVSLEDDPDAAWPMMVSTNRYYGRAAQPREIAYGVLFLASDEATFVTGHDLVMSGGQGEVAF